MKIKVVNIKCGGCINTIKKELKKVGATNIEVLFDKNNSSKLRIINFDGDFNKVKEKLIDLGYPEYGTEEAESILKKMKSFISCAYGKIE